MRATIETGLRNKFCVPVTKPLPWKDGEKIAKTIGVPAGLMKEYGNDYVVWRKPLPDESLILAGNTTANAIMMRTHPARLDLAAVFGE